MATAGARPLEDNGTMEQAPQWFRATTVYDKGRVYGLARAFLPRMRTEAAASAFPVFASMELFAYARIDPNTVARRTSVYQRGALWANPTS